jgi:hypothetical protein
MLNLSSIPSTPAEPAEEVGPGPSGIGGWLAVFLFLALLAAGQSVAVFFATLVAGTPSFGGFRTLGPMAKTLARWMLPMYGVQLVVPVLATVLLIRRWRGTPALWQAFLTVIVLFQAAVLVAVLRSEHSVGGMPLIIVQLAVNTAWIFYWERSRRVRRTFPDAFRWTRWAPEQARRWTRAGRAAAAGAAVRHRRELITAALGLLLVVAGILLVVNVRRYVAGRQLIGALAGRCPSFAAGDSWSCFALRDADGRLGEPWVRTGGSEPGLSFSPRQLTIVIDSRGAAPFQVHAAVNHRPFAAGVLYRQLDHGRREGRPGGDLRVYDAVLDDGCHRESKGGRYLLTELGHGQVALAFEVPCRGGGAVVGRACYSCSAAAF